MRIGGLLLFSLFIFSCTKEPANPAFRDSDITYTLTEMETDSLTGDTIFSVFIQNAFTPNQDGTNDYFAPLGTGISYYTLQIFNRFDNKIIEKNNEGWNGMIKKKSAMSGVYSYKISMKNFMGEQHFFSGIVMLEK